MIALIILIHYPEIQCLRILPIARIVYCASPDGFGLSFAIINRLIQFGVEITTSITSCTTLVDCKFRKESRDAERWGKKSLVRDDKIINHKYCVVQEKDYS